MLACFALARLFCFLCVCMGVVSVFLSVVPPAYPPPAGRSVLSNPPEGEGRWGGCVCCLRAPLPLSRRLGGVEVVFILCVVVILVGIGFPLGDIQSLPNDQSLSNSQELPRLLKHGHAAFLILCARSRLIASYALCQVYAGLPRVHEYCVIRIQWWEGETQLLHEQHALFPPPMNES